MRPASRSLSSQPSAFSLQLSAFSFQPSAFSLQLSAFSLQLSAFSLQPSAFTFQPLTFTMPSSDLKKLAAAFKRGTPEPAWYLYGPEDTLKDDAVRFILDQCLDPGVRDFNLDQVSAATLEPEAIEALCTTLPMLAERRVVVIRDVEQWKRRTRGRSAVVRYLAKPAPETVLVLVQGAGEAEPDKELVRHAAAVECVLSGREIEKWLDRRLADRGLDLAPAARDLLLVATQSSPSAMNIELEKLAALPAGITITEEQVGDLVGVRHGETPLDWRDAVLGDDAAEALKLLPLVLAQSGVSGVRLIALLGTSLIGAGIARAAWDKGQRGRTLNDTVFGAIKSHRPFGLRSWGDEAKLWTRWAEAWPIERVRGALDAALDADRAIKSTTLSDERDILTDLILRVAPATAGRSG
jgi:DNA polymerase-3 subunit delta